MSYRSDIVKRGRPARFKTATELWNTFVDYVNFTDGYAIELPQQVVKGNNRTEARAGKVTQPLTLDGFMAYCGVGQKWQDFARHQCDRGEDFSEVISRIRNIVRSDQLAGGMAGIYNSNLTARLNGLTDKQDLTSNGKQINIRFIDGANETDRD